MNEKIIKVEIAFIGITSLYLWHIGLNLESVISFAMASSLGFYAWNKNVNQVKSKLQKSGAFSPETAVKPEDANIPWWCEFILETLAEKTEDGRYYLRVEENPFKSSTEKALAFLKSQGGAFTTLGITLALISILTPIKIIQSFRGILFMLGLITLIYGFGKIKVENI